MVGLKGFEFIYLFFVSFRLCSVLPQGYIRASCEEDGVENDEHHDVRNLYTTKKHSVLFNVLACGGLVFRVVAKVWVWDWCRV